VVNEEGQQAMTNEKQQEVIKQFELQATAKFAAIPNHTDNPETSLFALADLEATRALTPTEKRIKVGLTMLFFHRLITAGYKRLASAFAQ
jgi:hypothetical protein